MLSTLFPVSNINIVICLIKCSELKINNNKVRLKITI